MSSHQAQSSARDTITGKSVSRNPAKLKSFEANSRKHSNAQIKMIEASINEFGFLKPIVIDEDSMILAGHGARIAAVNCELKTIPCRQIRGLSETQKRAFVIADNRSSELSTWDWQMLKIELTDLQSIDCDLMPIGFGNFGKDITHERQGHNVTIGDGRYLLQIEFEKESELQTLFEEMKGRGLAVKVLE